jgi:hypothetical protein
LWLFPFGVLVIRSGFIPKVLGALLLLASLAYPVESSFILLAPQHRDLIASIVTLPMAIGELSMVLWLLIRSVQRPPAESERSRPALASD